MKQYASTESTRKVIETIIAAGISDYYTETASPLANWSTFEHCQGALDICTQ